jgi:coenzyme F420-reducing hydrogenase delta subunit
MLPPSFAEYALRNGAVAVVVASCPPEDCGYRLGARWAIERLRGEREPRLRASVARDRVSVAIASREDAGKLAAAIERVREALAAPAAPRVPGKDAVSVLGSG